MAIKITGTLDELKHLAVRVLQLPKGTPFYSVGTYNTLQPLHLELTHALADLCAGSPADVRGEIERLRRLRNGMRSRKYKGTGSADTAEETWQQMHAAVLAGEPLRSVAERFGVLYTAAVHRARGWRPPPPPSNVVQLFPVTRRCRRTGV